MDCSIHLEHRNIADSASPRYSPDGYPGSNDSEHAQDDRGDCNQDEREIGQIEARVDLPAKKTQDVRHICVDPYEMTAQGAGNAKQCAAQNCQPGHDPAHAAFPHGLATYPTRCEHESPI